MSAHDLETNLNSTLTSMSSILPLLRTWCPNHQKEEKKWTGTWTVPEALGGVSGFTAERWKREKEKGRDPLVVCCTLLSSLPLPPRSAIAKTARTCDIHMSCFPKLERVFMTKRGSLSAQIQIFGEGGRKGEA